MPVEDVNQLADQLHQAGVVNLDLKVSDVLKAAALQTDPGSILASTAVAWDGYVIVYKGSAAGLNELQAISRGSVAQ
jgi:hypothetical protein